MMPTYVFDTGALISAERGKARAVRFLTLVRMGRARILIPLPVIAEWWRGRSDVREEILAASQVVASVRIAQAAGVALGKTSGAGAGAALAIDAIVMATAALTGAAVVTGDPEDFETLAAHFPKVAVLSA